MKCFRDNYDGYYEFSDNASEYMYAHLIPCAQQVYIPTPQEQRASISSAIQKMLDDKAISLRYKNIDSVAKYIGYPNPFQAEALRLATYAANCWAKADSIETQVNSGTIPMPTVVEALAMMPDY